MFDVRVGTWEIGRRGFLEAQSLTLFGYLVIGTKALISFCDLIHLKRNRMI